MEVSMVTKVGDRDVIRTMPFVQIKMALAAGHKTTRAYPAFDPLAGLRRGRRRRSRAGAPTGQIYGAKVESEMSLKTVDFPIDTAAFDEKSDLSADEVEEVVRDTGADPDRRRRPGGRAPLCRPAALRRCARRPGADRLLWRADRARRTSRSSPRAAGDDQAPAFAEDIIPFTADRDIAEAFADSGYAGDDAAGMAEAIAQAARTPRR